jgi:hypothetical protein
MGCPFPNPPAAKSISVRTSSEKCPECKEKDQEAFEVQMRACQQKAKDIQTWRDQSNNFKQKIIDAADNEKVRKKFSKWLKECNSLWAKEIKEAELDAATNSPPDPATSETLKKRLEKAEAKINLMLEAAEHLRDQEDHRIVEDEDEADYSNELALLNANCKEWKDLVESVGKLKKLYNDEVLETVRSVEGELEGIWKDAIRLMKS